MCCIRGEFRRGLVQGIRGKRCEASTIILVVFSWVLRLWDSVSWDVFIEICLFIGIWYTFTTLVIESWATLMEILPLTVFLLLGLLVLVGPIVLLVSVLSMLLRMVNSSVKIYFMRLAIFKPIVKEVCILMILLILWCRKGHLLQIWLYCGRLTELELLLGPNI